VSPGFAEFLGTVTLILLGNGVVANVVLEKTKGHGGGWIVIAAGWGFAIGLSLGGTTGYAINPARDLGPRIAHALLPIREKRDSDWAYAAIPVFGPIAGEALSAMLYRAMS